MQQISQILPSNNIPEYNKIQYRNAVYQGFLLNGKRHSFGILITDHSQVFIAQWAQGNINGNFIFLGHQIKVFGQMKDNKLMNFNIIESEHLTVYGYFKDNLLHGRVVFAYPDGFQISTFNKGINIVQAKQHFNKKQYQQQLKQILSLQFPDQFFKISQYLQAFSQQEYIILENSHFNEVQLPQNCMYYGFVNKQKQGEGLGFIINIYQNSILSCGYYLNSKLNGLGRLWLNKDEYQQGIFKDNILRGIGIRYNKEKDRYWIGRKYEGNNKIIFSGDDEGTAGQPIQQIKQLRKQFHLRSIHFIDQYILTQKMLKVNSIISNKQKLQNQILINSNKQFSKQGQGISSIKYLSLKNNQQSKKFSILHSQTKQQINTMKYAKRQSSKKQLPFIHSSFSIHSNPVPKTNNIKLNLPSRNLDLTQAQITQKLTQFNNSNSKATQIITNRSGKKKRIDLDKIYRQTGIIQWKRKKL